jgi:hypothetical protein
MLFKFILLTVWYCFECHFQIFWMNEVHTTDIPMLKQIMIKAHHFLNAAFVTFIKNYYVELLE